MVKKNTTVATVTNVIFVSLLCVRAKKCAIRTDVETSSMRMSKS